MKVIKDAKMKVFGDVCHEINFNNGTFILLHVFA